MENEKKRSPFMRFITSEFVVYIFFGVLTTAVSWITYAIFQAIIPDMTLVTSEIGTIEQAQAALVPDTATVVFGEGFLAVKSTVFANVLSWVCAFLFAFVTNKIWVFKSKSWAPRIALNEFWQFFIARFATGFIEWVGQPFLMSIGFDIVFTLPIIGTTKGMVSKILTSVIVVLLNYIFSKFIIFKKKKAVDPEDQFESAQKAIDEKLEEIMEKED